MGRKLVDVELCDVEVGLDEWPLAGEARRDRTAEPQLAKPDSCALFSATFCGEAINRPLTVNPPNGRPLGN